jgi:uncharacterized protein YecE (DUF72 family)
MVKVKVGICGFARSQDIIFTNLRLLEVQTTFYRPMKKSTAEKWRMRAPKDFEFTVKAWQLITHEPTSPTYRKAKLKIAENEVDKYGFFRSTDKVFEAWGVTNEIRKALDAEIVVFQCPASFKESEENINNMRDFFRSINNRGDIKLVWEQRGDWSKNTIGKICVELDLIHCVDPFAGDPVTQTNFAYFRLHGSPPGKRMYRYTYTEENLKKLYEKCMNMNFSEVYVLFNNDTMYEDALRFMKKKASGESLPKG